MAAAASIPRTTRALALSTLQHEKPLAELVVVDWDVTPGDHQAVEVQMGRRPLRASVQHPMVQPIEHLAGSDVEAVIDAACEREQAECFPA